jgi:streptomycin 6-kinase
MVSDTMTDIELPSEQRERVVAAFGEQGAAWAVRLPVLIRQAASRWQLEIEPPFPDLSYNFVAPARRGGRPVVAKLGVPNPELSSEIEALRLFDGDGAVRLLDADSDRGMMLLERLDPGTLLAHIQDDDRAMAIAGQTMVRLWRPLSGSHPFRSVDRWTEGLVRYWERGDGTGPIPEDLISGAVGGLAELRESAGDPLLLHADLHQFNILSSEERGWLAIDPKGAVGDPGYEVGPVIRNLLLACPNPKARLKDRVRRISAETGLEEGRVLRWAFAHTVLSLCWSVEDEQPWQEALTCARLMAEALR